MFGSAQQRQEILEAAWQYIRDTHLFTAQSSRSNIDADDISIATNNVCRAFAQKTKTATNVQHTLTVGESKLLDCFRSLRDHISCKVEPFKLPRGFSSG